MDLAVVQLNTEFSGRKFKLIYKMNRTLYQVKAGPFLSVERVDQLYSLLLKKGMQGAKIIIE